MMVEKTAHHHLEPPSKQLNGFSRIGPSVRGSRVRRAIVTPQDAARTRSCAAKAKRTHRLGGPRRGRHHQGLTSRLTAYLRPPDSTSATISLRDIMGSVRRSSIHRQSNWDDCHLLQGQMLNGEPCTLPEAATTSKPVIIPQPPWEPRWRRACIVATPQHRSVTLQSSSCRQFPERPQSRAKMMLTRSLHQNQVSLS